MFFFYTELVSVMGRDLSGVPHLPPVLLEPYESSSGAFQTGLYMYRVLYFKYVLLLL